MAQLQRLAIAPAQIQNQQILLTDEQQHYLIRVLRMQPGDRFIALDGQGNSLLSVLENNIQAQIIESLLVKTELPVAVTLMLALPKGNGFDEVVRQTTELGVACILPVISDRTLLHPGPQKLERWRRIAQEAAEQSERQIIPTILEPVSFTKGLSLLTEDKQYICVARGEFPHLLNSLPNKAQIINQQKQMAIAIAIGPEGGWTPIEIEQAIAKGFQPVSLGRRILRAVTAPLVTLSLVAALSEAEGLNNQV